MNIYRCSSGLILGVVTAILITFLVGGHDVPIWAVIIAVGTVTIVGGYFWGLGFSWKHGKKVRLLSLLSLGMLVFVFWPVTIQAGKALLADFVLRSEPRRFESAQVPIPWTWIKIHSSTGVTAITNACLTVFCHPSATMMTFDDETGLIKKGMSEEIWSRAENGILQREGFQTPTERS